MILELSNLLKTVIEKTLEEKVAIAFSGGIDSTTIATVAKNYSEIELFSIGTKNSQDLDCSTKIAKELALPLTKVVVEEKQILDAYKKCQKILPLDFLNLEILVPVYLVAESAKEKGHKVLLFGSAAEELFIGYARYYDLAANNTDLALADLDSLLKEEYRTLIHRDIAYVKKICQKFSLEARFPFYNDNLAKFVFSIPIEERMSEREMKKGILREAAKLLGVPKLALERQKKAMQYGSGIHKILAKHSKDLQPSSTKSLTL